MVEHAGGPLRVCLIGYGLAGRIFHAPLLTAEPGMKLAAVVTGNPVRQEQVELDFPNVEIFESLPKFLGDSERFDLAVIASPTSSHTQQVLQVLGANLDVVVEKPISDSAAKAEQIHDLAVQKGRQVHVFQNRRWDSDFLSLRSAILSGAVGNPIMLESRMEFWRPVMDNSWRNSPHTGNPEGVLLDLGCHLVDQAIQLMGPVVSVFADQQALRPGAQVNDDVLVILNHQGGASSHLVMSKAAPFQGPRFKLVGVDGVAQVDWYDSQEGLLRESGDPASAGWGRERASPYVRLRKFNQWRSEEEMSVAPMRGQWNTFYGNVLASLTKGSPPPVPLRDTIETMRVLDCAQASAREKRFVHLSPPAFHAATDRN